MSLRATSEGRSILAARLGKAGMWPLVERIAREHMVDARGIIGHRRHASKTAARHHLWAVIRWSTGMSYPEIAIMFDVDHTSVMHGVCRYESELAARYAA
jgi:chromosomal replication initiation ATPase DnaA